MLIVSQMHSQFQVHFPHRIRIHKAAYSYRKKPKYLPPTNLHDITDKRIKELFEEHMHS